MLKTLLMRKIIPMPLCHVGLVVGFPVFPRVLLVSRTLTNGQKIPIIRRRERYQLLQILVSVAE
jgi:hypothetical protein